MAKGSKKLIDAQNTWEDKISRSKKVRNYWKELFHIDTLREYLDGKQNEGHPGDEWITVNKLLSHLKAQLPALYAVDPYFYIKLARTYKPDPKLIALWEQRGKIRSHMLNYLKKELKLKEKARLGILDAHTSFGVLKIAYHADMVENERAGQPLLSEESDEPLLGEDGESLLEPEETLVSEHYEISRIHPDDFMFDEDSGPLEDDWHWLGQRIVEPYKDIKANKKFNQKAVRALRNSGTVMSTEDQEREDRKKGGDVKGRSEMESDSRVYRDLSDDEPIVRWEIYDLDNDKFHVIAEGGELPLIYDGETPGVDTHPFAILRLFIRDDSPYPHPPLSPGLDAQKEYNLARSRILTHRKRFNRKYEVYHGGLASEEEVSKLESGEDGTVILKNTYEQCVKPIQDAQLDQWGAQELGYLDRDLIETLGSESANTIGVAKAESATQASILDKRLDLREGDTLGLVIDWIQVVAEKLDHLIQANITRDEAVKVTGPMGEYWEIVKMEDYDEIEGDYEYTVNVGASTPRMPHIERSQWLAFLNLLGSFPHLALSPRLMKQMAEMHHIEDEVMLQELEQIVKKMMGGQMPMSGGGKSKGGIPEERPASAELGKAGGVMSMGQPGGGNL